jgi:hypothetical protein
MLKVVGASTTDLMAPSQAAHDAGSNSSSSLDKNACIEEPWRQHQGPDGTTRRLHTMTNARSGLK